MSILGKDIRHKLWGIGTIINIDDAHITVSFPPPIGQKVFVYPQAFESFLSFSEEMPPEVAKALESANALKHRKDSIAQSSSFYTNNASRKIQRHSVNGNVPSATEKLPRFLSIDEGGRV